MTAYDDRGIRLPWLRADDICGTAPDALLHGLTPDFSEQSRYRALAFLSLYVAALEARAEGFHTRKVDGDRQLGEAANCGQSAMNGEQSAKVNPDHADSCLN
jgi:hypothetical protein